MPSVEYRVEARGGLRSACSSNPRVLDFIVEGSSGADALCISSRGARVANRLVAGGIDDYSGDNNCEGLFGLDFDSPPADC